MRNVFAAAAVMAVTLSVGAGPVAAQDNNGCPDGTFDVVLTPDGGTLTILFSAFVIEAGDAAGRNTDRKSCRLHVPLNLPPDTSVGVYKVDYRGFALLAQQQQFELSVVYGFNGGRDHSYRRQLRGEHGGDFAFSQTIGAGLMRRVGCGQEAALDVEARISLNANGRPGDALAALDSLDGVPKGGLVYFLRYDKCSPGNR
jgi:hypothetical protein